MRLIYIDLLEIGGGETVRNNDIKYSYISVSYVNISVRKHFMYHNMYHINHSSQENRGGVLYRRPGSL